MEDNEHSCPNCGESVGRTDKNCDLPDEHVCPEDVRDEYCTHECVICGFKWLHTGGDCSWPADATCKNCGIPSDNNFYVPNVLRQVLELGVSSLNDKEFEELAAEFFKIMGYEVSLTPVTGDQGIDLIIRLRDSPTFLVAQCKHWQTPVGAPAVREFYGSLIHSGATQGFLIATNGFTDAAREFAAGKPIVLARGQSFPSWILSIIARNDAYFLLRSKDAQKSVAVEPQVTEQKPSVEGGKIIIP